MLLEHEDDNFDDDDDDNAQTSGIEKTGTAI